MDGNRARRILVLGSAPHSLATEAYRWNDLPDDVNAADFDIVILNFLPFEREELAATFDASLLPPADQFTRLLCSGGEVIAIGAPELVMGRRQGMFPISTTWWLPFDLDVKFESGEVVLNIDERAAFFFDHVKRWSFYLNQTPQVETEHKALAQMLHARATDVRTDFLALAQTRFGAPIGWRVHLLAGNETAGGQFLPLATSGSVIWLPQPEVDDEEAVDLILRRHFGGENDQALPEWLTDFQLPEEKPLLRRAAELEDAAREIAEEQEKLKLDIARTQSPKAILYGQGEAVLEPAVFQVLTALGAEVSTPTVRGREDARIAVGERLGMLEVKGRTGSIKLDDVRQLQHWVTDADAEEEWAGKGLLVANTYCDRAPENRLPGFPDNCIRFARRYHICLIATPVLYEALVLVQERGLDLDAFWERVFDTDGVLTWP